MFKSHFEVNFHVTPKLEVNFKFNFRMISNFDFETGSGFDTNSDSDSSFFATLIPTSIPVFDLDTDFGSIFHTFATCMINYKKLFLHYFARVHLMGPLK